MKISHFSLLILCMVIASCTPSTQEKQKTAVVKDNIPLTQAELKTLQNFADSLLQDSFGDNSRITMQGDTAVRNTYTMHMAPYQKIFSSGALQKRYTYYFSAVSAHSEHPFYLWVYEYNSLSETARVTKEIKSTYACEFTSTTISSYIFRINNRIYWLYQRAPLSEKYFMAVKNKLRQIVRPYKTEELNIHCPKDSSGGK